MWGVLARAPAKTNWAALEMPPYHDRLKFLVPVSEHVLPFHSQLACHSTADTLTQCGPRRLPKAPLGLIFHL